MVKQTILTDTEKSTIEKNLDAVLSQTQKNIIEHCETVKKIVNSDSTLTKAELIAKYDPKNMWDEHPQYTRTIWEEVAEENKYSTDTPYDPDYWTWVMLMLAGE